jgi:3'(2'), 5'-bisphosphate nucleotidase
MDSIMEWDTAAGQAIVEAAGGHVRSWPNGEPLMCNNVDMRNSEFIAIAPGRDVSMFFESMG